MGLINISMAVYVRPFELELYMYEYIKVREVIKYGYNLYIICTLV